MIRLRAVTDRYVTGRKRCGLESCCRIVRPLSATGDEEAGCDFVSIGRLAAFGTTGYFRSNVNAVR
jgi:hypothetical protein